MANFEIPNEPVYADDIRMFETTDPAHADLFNRVIGQLLENEAYLKEIADSHIENVNNPHNVTKSQVGLGNVDNTSDSNKPVSTLQQAALDTYYQQTVSYTDKQIADLINGAPDTLDTLGEIAKAMQENDTVVEALHDAIGNKANDVEFQSHANNDNIHHTNKNIVDLIYPVGSIYQSSKNTNPGTLFGGTWTQLKDVVLVAAGSTFKAGTTGGSATHTLTVQNLPTHNHTFTGTAVNSSTESTAHTHTVHETATGAHNHNVKVSTVGGLEVSSGAYHGQVYVSQLATQYNIETTYGDNLGNHTHNIWLDGESANHCHSVTAKGTIGNTGSGTAVNHMPPYKVMYAWERTA